MELSNLLIEIKLGVIKKIFTLVLCLACFCGVSQNNIAYLGTADISSKKEKTSPTASNTSSFNFSGGLIMVNVSVNGERGDYILDTGAPGLVLNSTVETESFVHASSVSSSIRVGEILVENFQWGNLEKTNVEGYTLDISHMGKANAESPDGLIGYQILKSNSVLVNFENQEVAILSKKDLRSTLKQSKGYVTIPFETEGHLPVIKLKINGKKYRFAIDTGAEKNLMDDKSFVELNPENVKFELMQGLDGGIRKVAIGQLENIASKAYDIDKMNFLFSDMSYVNEGENGYNIDGLLGLPFFQNKTFVIDYRKGEIHVWK